MESTLKVGTGIALALAISVLPATPSSAQVPLQSESRVWFEGSSTVRDFTCEAEAVSGTVATVPAARLTLQGLKAGFRGVEVVVPVAALECRNGTMNTHMRRALLSEQHPEIRFRSTSYEVVREGSAETVIRLTGGLTMAGQTREITFEATATANGDGSIRAIGNHAFLMTEWGVRPPSLMLGAMKVRDRVNVRFDVVVKP